MLDEMLFFYSMICITHKIVKYSQIQSFPILVLRNKGCIYNKKVNIYNHKINKTKVLNFGKKIQRNFMFFISNSLFFKIKSKLIFFLQSFKTDQWMYFVKNVLNFSSSHVLENVLEKSQ